MTKRKTTPAASIEKPADKTVATPAVKRADPVRRADASTIKKALDDLGIDKPYYSARVVGGRLELALYGGDIVTWPEAASKAKRSPAQETGRRAATVETGRRAV